MSVNACAGVPRHARACWPVPPRVFARCCVRVAVLATVAYAAGLAAGCATLPPPVPRAATAAPARSAARAAPAASRRAAAVADTVPSGDAVAVLRTIPEPLSESERVSPPSIAQGAASDSTLATAAFPADSAAADSGNPQAPVPEPTVALGDRAPDTLAVAPPPAAAPPTTTAPAAPVRPAAPATAAGCWRVQIAAPADRTRADRYRAAAESQLLVPFVIEHDRGLWKVRTRDCLDDAASLSLDQRAVQAGFTGVFRIAGRKP